MSATILPSPRVDVIPDRWDRLPTLALKSGSHTPPTGDGAPQACVMEAIAWVTGGDWTDRPDCVSPVLHRPFQRVNDTLDTEKRQDLLPLAVQAMGTAGDGLDPQRFKIASRAVADLLVPWLRLAGLDTEADAVLTAGDIAALRVACRAASDAAWTARRVARDRLRKRIEKRVRKQLKKHSAAAADAAAAVAAAAAADAAAAVTADAAVAVTADAAVAAAVAAAAAVAEDVAADAAEDVAADAAEAAAVAVAAAAAEDAAAAVAEDAAVAVAEDADWSAYGPNWSRVYDAVRAYLREHPITLPAEVTELAEAQRGAALELLARLIDPTQAHTAADDGLAAEAVSA